MQTISAQNQLYAGSFRLASQATSLSEGGLRITLSYITLRAQTPFPSPKRGFYKLFLSQKEKVTKRSWRACRSTALPLQLPTKKNGDLTSRKGFRFKCAAPDELQIPPIGDFSPPSAYNITRTSSLALRPARRMGTDGAWRGELPSANAIHSPP